MQTDYGTLAVNRYKYMRIFVCVIAFVRVAAAV